MFINFTSNDAKKLLSGVAPSGSSKRKREEEELARNNAASKSARTSFDQHGDASELANGANTASGTAVDAAESSEEPSHP